MRPPQISRSHAVASAQGAQALGFVRAGSRARALGAGAGRRPQALVALSVYTLFSVVYFGLPVLAHMSSAYIGAGQDVQIFIWALRWWPYAIAHGLDPFFTHLVWAPAGADVTWTSSVPGASLLALPITETLGPTFAWNVLCLAAPVSAAWATFLLCRRLTRSFWAALVGGYLFGFSSYELAAMLAHLHLSCVFAVPLVAYLLLRRVQGEIGERGLTLALTATLTLQFLFSTEIFATACGFGSLALLCGWWLSGAGRRQRILALTRPLLVALLATLVLVSPLALHMLTHVPTQALNSPVTYSADLANLIVPTRATGLGGEHFRGLSRAVNPAAFSGDASEKPAYLGIPLLIILALFVARRRRAPLTRLLAVLLLVSIATALGPVLQVGGHHVSWSPVALLFKLPLLANAAPARLIMYGDLAVAVMVALWLGQGPRRAPRWAAVAVALVLLAPNVSWRAWHSSPEDVRFVSSGAYRQAIGAGDTVLTLPFAYRGDGMWALAETNMYFHLAGGALQPTPPEYQRLPIFATLSAYTRIPNAAAEFERFLRAESVREIVVDRSQLSRWQWLLSTVPTRPREVQDALVYRVPDAKRPQRAMSSRRSRHE